LSFLSVGGARLSNGGDGTLQPKGNCVDLLLTTRVETLAS